MNTVLLSAGVACVIAAVVGGGLKAFNVDVPVISSLLRQGLLFVVGLGFLASAWLLRDPTVGQDTGDDAYRQLAVAACGRIVEIRTADLPVDAIDFSTGEIRFHKAPLVRELKRREAGMQAELASLWTHDPPTDLGAQQDRAEKVTAEWLRRFHDQIRELDATASDPVRQADADLLEHSGDAALRARTNDAMTELAGKNCPIAG